MNASAACTSGGSGADTRSRTSNWSPARPEVAPPQTLLHVAATRPDLVPVITRAMGMPGDGTRFEPAAVGALGILAPQTEVKLTLSTQGKWS